MRGRMLRLAPRGFGNRQIAFTPGRRGVHASARRPRPCLPETGRTSTGIVALSRPARSSRSPVHGPFNRSTLTRISNRKVFMRLRCGGIVFRWQNLHWRLICATMVRRNFLPNDTIQCLRIIPHYILISGQYAILKGNRYGENENLVRNNSQAVWV